MKSAAQQVTTTNQSVSLAGRASARPAGPRPGRADSSRAARTRRKWYEIIGLTTPAVIVYTMFVLVPMGFAVYYSLYRWRGVRPAHRVRRTAQLLRLAFEDPIFLDALRNNAIIVVGSLLIQGPIALGVALLLNRRFRGRAVFRLLVFVPVRARRGHRRHHVEAAPDPRRHGRRAAAVARDWAAWCRAGSPTWTSSSGRCCSSSPGSTSASPSSCSSPACRTCPTS